MVDDPLFYICDEIRKVLAPGSASQDPPRIIKLIDKTISFPLKENVWRNCFRTEPDRLLRKLSRTDAQEKFKRKLNHLVFPIESVRAHSDFIMLSFNRQQITKFLFNEILESKTFGRNITVNQNQVELLPMPDCDQENLCNYRIKLVHDCLQNVLQLIKFTSNESKLILSVTGASSSTTSSVKCGLVVENQTKKVCELKSSEYIELRSTVMRLIATHRNGMRSKEGFKEMVAKLGLAAVSIDLLEVKHTSPVQINRTGQGCTKGVSFILYNSARLETLLRIFDAAVQSGNYSRLPKLEEIDFNLLNGNEEWQLIFSYIFTFPHIIKRCVSDLNKGHFPIHNIIQYIQGLVALFSVYYRRTKILTQSIDHLMPVTHARIYLLKCVQHILNMSLSILNIEPVQIM